MIQSNELRIGNNIKYSLHILTVDEIRKMGGGYVVTKEGINGYLLEYDGIELTPEILEKCGFIDANEKDPFGGWLIGIPSMPKGNKLRVRQISASEFNWQIMEGSYAKLKYLHQLQNVYFALTNEELNVQL